MAIFIMRGAFNELLPSGTAVLTSVTPSVIDAGATLTITIIGTNTNFVQGTYLAPIPGLTVNSLTVVNPGTLVADVTASDTPPTTPQSILAITGTKRPFFPTDL
jgi:hypothetical protein